MMIENEPDPLRRIPTKRPAEIRAEIGAVLRAARLKRGLSLEAVAAQTRISKRFLEALEEDRFDEFPAFVYMRGFLKGYCDHLDVPFEEMWAKIQPAAEPAPGAAAPTPKPPAPSASAPTPAPVRVPDPALHGHALTPRPHAAPDAAGGGSSATGAILFALALAVALGAWLYNDRKPAEPARAAETIPRALLPLPRAVEPKVTLRAIDDAWVRATVDGSVVFEGRIPRGAAMEWEPAHVVSLRTTAPTSLALTVDGAPRPLVNPSPDGEYRIDLP